MRIGCLQFAPQVGDVDNNLNRADAVLNKANPKDLDLLVLPELAFSGYNFKSLVQIAPFLEPCGSGISALWARTTALKYNCHVAVGYPEKIDPTESWPTSPEYYNSVIIVNEDGETVANYHKSHLYYTDETWALEGDEGFYEGYIPGLGDTSIGICMDLNPYKFEAPWSAFEFAFHVLECRSNLAIVSMAWMTREDGRVFSRMPNEPDMDTLTYWATRLEPLIRAESDREIIVIFCNRTGMEDEAVYAGTSAVVGILDGEVRVYGVLGRGEKELLLVDTDNPPYAKLVHHQENGTTAVRGELQTSETSITPQAARAKQGENKSRRSQDQGSTPPTHSHPSATKAIQTVAEESTALHTRRSRPQPQIQIPTYSNRQTTNDNSATSNKSMDSDIPTPSAPSPTPNGTRPKLMIPQPPYSAVQQGFSPMPMSALSTHSVQSNMSSRSRAPEDSTPYPHSGIPRSGYPRSHTNYSGQMSATQNRSSPETPFESGSQLSSREYRGYGSAAPTPSDVSSQVSYGTTSTRRRTTRRAFQEWPILKPKQAEPENTPQANRRTATPQGSNSELAYRQSQGRRPDSTLSERQYDGSRDTSGTSSHLGRVAPPKSRSASQTKNRDRSDSSLSYRNDNTEIEQILDSVRRRAESASRNHGQDDQGPIPSRPQSRKAQDRSTSRPDASIIMGPNGSNSGRDLTRPSTGGLNGPNSQRGTSQGGVHSRSASISEDARLRTRSQTPIQLQQDVSHPSSRAVSRGRRPGPHSSVVSQVDIERSSDSLGGSKGNQKLVSRQVQVDLSYDSPRSGRQSHETSRHRAGVGTPSRQPSAVNSHDDEVTFCPHCSSEIRTPSKTPSRQTQSALGDYQSSQRQVLVGSKSPLSSQDHISLRSASLDSRASLSNSFAVSEVDSLADMMGTTSGLEISPSTPDYNDLKTPRAMVFIRDADEAVDVGKSKPPSPEDKFIRSTYMKEIVL